MIYLGLFMLQIKDDELINQCGNTKMVVTLCTVICLLT